MLVIGENISDAIDYFIGIKCRHKRKSSTLRYATKYVVISIEIVCYYAWPKYVVCRLIFLYYHPLQAF